MSKALEAEANAYLTIVRWRLIIARRMKDMTTRDLATWVGKSQSFVSHIENGRTQVRLRDIYVLARRYKVPLEELIGPIRPEEQPDFVRLVQEARAARRLRPL